MNRYNYYPTKKFGKCSRVSKVLKHYGRGIYSNYSITYNTFTMPLIEEVDNDFNNVEEKNYMDYCISHIDFNELEITIEKNYMDYCLMHISFDE